MFANKADYEKAVAAEQASQNAREGGCPKADTQYCDYPYCSCKEETAALHPDVIPNVDDIGC